MTGSITDPNSGQTPSYFNQTTTAWTDTTKASLGLIKDTVGIPFTEINQRYQSGIFGGFGYKATSSNPLLHPLESGVMGKFGSASLNWMGNYDELVATLPQEVQLKLAQLSNQEPGDRDASMVVLNQVLILTAKTLGEVESIGVNEPDLARIHEKLLDYGNNAIGYGSLVGQTFQNFIDNETPNNPDYYAVINALNRAHTTMVQLNHLIEKMKDLKVGDELSKEDKTEAAIIAKDFSTIATGFEKASSKRDLNAITDTFNALSVFAGALSLPLAGSISLYMGAHLSAIGKDSPDLSALIKDIVPSANPATVSFANQLLTSLLTAASALGSYGSSDNTKDSTATTVSSVNFLLIGMVLSYISDVHTGLVFGTACLLAGLGAFGKVSLTPKEEEEQNTAETAKFMASGALVRIATESGIFALLFKELGVICGAKESEQASMSEICSGISLVLTALSCTRYSKRYSASMIIEQEALQIQSSIDSATAVIRQRIEENSSPHPEHLENLSVILDMMTRAMEERNYQGVLGMFISCIEKLGISSHALFTQIDKNKELAKDIKKMVNGDKDSALNEVITFV